MSQLIQSKIDTVRRKHAVVRAGFGAGTMGIVVVSVLAGTMLIDWFFDLPYLVRCAMLAIHVSALLYLLGRYVLWPLIKGPDDETVALWIEAFYEDAASRIISAVQFSRKQVAGMGSPLMIGAAVKEAEAYIQPKDTGEVIVVDDMVKRAAIALLLFVIGGGLLLWGKENTRDLLYRAVCVPGVEVPRKTRVELLVPLKRIVAKGDTIRIAALAHGVIPNEGTLRVRYNSGATAEFFMKPDRDQTEKFVIEIDNVQDSFSYRVLLNDGRSENAAVEAHPRPDVADIKITQQLPAYTKQPPVTRNKSDLRILAGSRLQLRVTANKPLKDTVSLDGPRNRVRLEGVDQTFYLKRDPTDPRVLTTNDGSISSIPIAAGTTGMSVHLVDELGLESKDSAVYRIEVVPDAPPVVNITYPQLREELMTERAATTIAFELSDDIGVAGARIRHIPVGADTKLEGDGLTGAYFNNKDLEGEPVVTRIDPKIDMQLDTNGSPMPQLGRDNFSIRWTGKLLPPQTGTYIFTIHSDDGTRFWVGDKQLLDMWGPQSGEFKTEAIELEAGKMVDIKLEYQEIGADARCRLIWTKPDKRREVIPTAAIFSGDESVRTSRLKRTSTIELNLGETKTSIRGQYKWDIASLKLQPGDAIEWWIEAEDGNNQTGPGRTDSEHRTIRIGSEAQVREYLLGRLGNPLEQIQTIQEDQVDLTGTLGQIIIEKPGTKPPDERQRP